MQRTDNFNLIVVEGSDTVNLLTQMNPNTEVIDEQMFKNQNAGVQTATELLSGTVHAITRSIPDASMIRFTAVSRFTAGDTFTVDGVQVSALLPSGEQLPDGAFIIGSEVLCVLKGTLLTVFASGGAVALAKDAEKLGGQLPTYYATKAEVDSAQATASSAGSLAETALSNSESAYNIALSSKPVVLWTNPNLGVQFPAQDIALNDNISNYSYYEIIYQNLITTGVTDLLYCKASTGRIPTDSGAFMVYPLLNSCTRGAKVPNGNTIRITDAKIINSNSNNIETSNNGCLPYMILGYK